MFVSNTISISSNTYTTLQVQNIRNSYKQIYVGEKYLHREFQLQFVQKKYLLVRNYALHDNISSVIQ